MEKPTYVSIFLEELASTPRSEVTEIMPFAWWRDEGTLILSAEEQRKFREVTAKLITAKSPISRQTVERHLKAAIFEVLDFAGRREGTPQDRIGPAVRKLRGVLGIEPQRRWCFVEVGNLDTADLPRAFGRVRFVKFNRSQADKFVRAERKFERPHIMPILRETLEDEILWDKPCAIVVENARDMRAAYALAEKEVALTVDVLNFFYDLAPFSGWLYLPRWGRATNVYQPVLSEDGSYKIDAAAGGPLPDFSFSKLRNNEVAWRAARRIGALLRENQRAPIEQALLTGIQWAGQASVEQRQEKSFLYYAIALESVFLEADPQELTQRLALRIANYLGNSTTNRRELFRRIKKLYGLRSKIVHNGVDEVPDKELAVMRAYAKAALVRLINQPSRWKRQGGFSQKEKGKRTREWREWLESLTIR